MAARPVNALLANALALLNWPALAVMERANSGCGDGLCGVFSGLLVLATLAAAALVFVLRSARRSETPALLRVTPFLLWAVALGPLVV